jgi:hypothetical protein
MDFKKHDLFKDLLSFMIGINKTVDIKVSAHDTFLE